MQEMRELYQLEDGKWVLYPYLVTCTDNGVQEQKYIDDLEFYESYKELHDGFTIEDVQELTYTGEQLLRLNEIQGLSYKDYDEIYDYVMTGNIKTDSKIFAVKVAEQTRADIDYLSIMTGVEL